MKYFLDTEFIEGFHKPLFGKRRHFIDLISIGIVCEDGREYYAISKDFDPADADEWVTINVLAPIMDAYIQSCNGELRQMVLGCFGNKKIVTCVKMIQKWIGKTNKEISLDIENFTMSFATCKNGDTCCKMYQPSPSDLKDVGGIRHNLEMKRTDPEFYAYYADYDWVVFCSLFGLMIDLPKGFPMYCMDLKQWLDSMWVLQEKKYSGMSREEAWLQDIKKHPDYPQQKYEHNALADARWNFELYNFLTRIVNTA